MCQRHRFSALNHEPAYSYNDARVIKWLTAYAIRALKGGTRSFED